MAMTFSPSSNRFSRRALVGSTAAGGVLTGLAPLRLPGVDAAAKVPTSAAQSAAPSPAAWRTWLLASPDAVRPSRPGAVSSDEIEELISFQAHPSADMTAAVATWGANPIMAPWCDQANQAFKEFSHSGIVQSRDFGLLLTAINDAVLAAWDAQVAYNRPSPAATDKRINAPAGVDPSVPSFPSMHAAVAAAAATVLAFLLPGAKPGRFDAIAQEAAMSRLWAGAAFRSDMEAGLAIGQAVGARAVARGKGDGYGQTFTGAIPKGPGFWQPTPPKFLPPEEPLAGTWKPWVLEKNDQFRPSPPPAYESAAWQSELETVQQARDPNGPDWLTQTSVARWYQQYGPFVLFSGWALDLIAKYALDAPHAARVMASLGVAFADQGIAIWEAKYVWWTERPVTADPSLVPAFPTPNYPSYPSGYSAAAAAAATVLSSFFPHDAVDISGRAWEAQNSRCWAGIHYQIDDDTGMLMGRRVGSLVTALARADEAAGAM